MKLVDFIKPEDVFLGIEVTAKDQLLADISEKIANKNNLLIDAKELCTALKEREYLASTCVSSDVAIPHAKMLGLLQPQIYFFRTIDRVFFDEPLKRAVQLFFVVLIPPNGVFAQAKILCKIEKLCRDCSFVQKLMSLNDPQEVLSELITRDA